MITTWSRGVADENMPEEILAALGEPIRRHPWWAARARLTLELLDRLGVRPPARVLDAGCGWGVTLEQLENQGYQAVGLDQARQALTELDRPGRDLVEADLTQPWPEDVEPFAAVLALDVIEHLDDDRAVVARLGQLVAPGGVAVLSVPALPELFSEFDTIQGHRRRYLPESLRPAFEGSGLEVEQLFWWGAWMVPLLTRRRRTPTPDGRSAAEVYRDYLRLPPWPIPWLFRLAFALEQGPALRGRLANGTSLFAVARKPTPPPHRNSEPEEIGRTTERQRRTIDKGGVLAPSGQPCAIGRLGLKLQDGPPARPGSRTFSHSRKLFPCRISPCVD